MSGLDYEDWRHRKIWRRWALIEGRLVRANVLRDSYVMGVDVAAAGGDQSVYTLARTPGRIRRFLRKLRLDRSTWAYKIVKTEAVDHGRR